MVVCRWQRAIKRYKRAAELVDSTDRFGHDEKVKAGEVLKSCQLNLAAAYLKLGDYAEAHKAADKVGGMHYGKRMLCWEKMGALYQHDVA